MLITQLLRDIFKVCKLDSRANVDACTLYMEEAELGHAHIVQLLWSSGAEANAKALYRAAEHAFKSYDCSSILVPM